MNKKEISEQWSWTLVTGRKSKKFKERKREKTVSQITK